MSYKTLRKAFHDPTVDEAALYNERFNSESTVHLNFTIAGYPAFFIMCPEIYTNIIDARRLDKDIFTLTTRLPGKALDHYTTHCLIDEVVLTNEIEGVNSSRREIEEVLEHLQNNDRKGRFYGIVSKYLLLQSNEPLALENNHHIRKLYEDLVLDEVIASNKNNYPDGSIFRKESVSIYDPAGRVIHNGVEPEKKIIDYMQHALDVLNNNSLDLIVRVSLFHFLFGFIHPFYDGNGRINRFISSYLLAHDFEPIIGYRLSYTIKENREKYYTGFTLCEHSLNKGDLTPFIVMFSEIIVEAITSMKNSLIERKMALDDLVEAIPYSEVAKSDTHLQELMHILIQATLFSEEGITVTELQAIFTTSKPTLYKRIKLLTDKNLVVKKQLGHKHYYRINSDTLQAQRSAALAILDRYVGTDDLCVTLR
ncbi:MAG: Fic family protein [Raoultibacter sp.]